MTRALVLMLVLALTGCTPALPPVDEANDDIFLYDPGLVARSARIAIFVPGALTSVAIFAPARGWRASGFAPVFYRFPGIDGRALGPLDIDEAANQIASFAAAYPDKDVALMGYSSGAPIAILAATRIDDGRNVPVVAISPAVERAGGLPTLARGASDILRATARAQSLNQRDIWIEYWQILLRGRNAPPIPSFRERVAEVRQTHRGEREFGPPDPNLARSHTARLQRWELPEDLRLDHVHLRIFAGLEDPVFSTAQTLRFARQLGQDRVFGYPGEGHLLYLTQTDVFETGRLYADRVLAAQ